MRKLLGTVEPESRILAAFAQGISHRPPAVHPPPKSAVEFSGFRTNCVCLMNRAGVREEGSEHSNARKAAKLAQRGTRYQKI